VTQQTTPKNGWIEKRRKSIRDLNAQPTRWYLQKSLRDKCYCVIAAAAENDGEKRESEEEEEESKWDRQVQAQEQG